MTTTNGEAMGMALIAFVIVLAMVGYALDLHANGVSPFGIAGKLGQFAGVAVILLFLGPPVLLVAAYGAIPVTLILAIPLLFIFLQTIAREKRRILADEELQSRRGRPPATDSRSSRLDSRTREAPRQ